MKIKRMLIILTATKKIMKLKEIKAKKVIKDLNLTLKWYLPRK